jgi:predicted nuclease of predicted toxin-antitoxin system
MLLLSDENFNGEIVRGLLRRRPDLDLVRVQDVGLIGHDDPSVLEWAAQEGRILLTHDRATIPDFAYERINAGSAMPGVFVIGNRYPVGQAIEEILLLVLCSEAEEWEGIVC